MAVSEAASGILGGAFDPPHLGHVALARGAIEHFGLDRLLVRVVERPRPQGGRHPGRGPAGARRARVRSRSPEAEIALDPYARTVDSLEALGLDDPVFLVGADEFVAFPTWKEPRAGARARAPRGRDATRVDRGDLEPCSPRSRRPDRVELFPIAPHAISSSEIRERVRGGEPIAELVPPAVAAEIDAARAVSRLA